jgi:hypothetical protein
MKMTQRQARKDSKAGSETLKGRLNNTNRQARNDSKAGSKRLKGK